VSGILRDGDVIRPIVWIDWSIDEAYQGIEARLEVEYRGHGLYTDSAMGQQVSGDHACRRLVMLINDFLVHEEQRDQRQWLRQATDLLTLLVMLRAILYTRITGDAGMKRQRLALVPVGAVGMEELLSLMSQYVVSFINEADIYVRRGAN
jgi:hypothetical protein